MQWHGIDLETFASNLPVCDFLRPDFSDFEEPLLYRRFENVVTFGVASAPFCSSRTTSREVPTGP